MEQSRYSCIRDPTLAQIALLLARRGDSARALEVWAMVSRYPFVGNSQFFADLYGRPVEAAAADLPPDAVEAARQRGRTLDPWETARALASLAYS